MLSAVNNYFQLRELDLALGAQQLGLHCPAVTLRYIVMLIVAGASALPCAAQRAPQDRVQDAVDAAMQPHPGTAVLLDLRSNKNIAAHDLSIAAQRLASPGSTVKSFVLLKLLETGKAKLSERYVCPRRVRIGTRRVNCTHPDLPGPIDPTDALAWSCNAYFAAAARRLSPGELAEALRRAGLTAATGLSPREAL